MLKSLLRMIFGDKQKRDIARLTPIVQEINKIAEEYRQLSDTELQNKTNEFRKLLQAPTRLCRCGGQVFLLDGAEQLLAQHPDVAKCVFVPTRRDIHEGAHVAYVVPKPESKPSKDLAEQIKVGMTRWGAPLSPKNVIFIDEIPTIEVEGAKKIDYHTMQRVAEELELPEWQATTAVNLFGQLKQEEKPYTLQDLLPDAFAAIKETCRRFEGKSWMVGGNPIVWNMVPFDVQLMGGIALTQQAISEMGTGEGKTLTAILPLYLHALAARGSHLVTVNDYLAKRDSEWNQPIFEFLGMTVACIDKTQPHTPERRNAYLADVTYGTNNEFGFDYLRDNMATQAEQLVQRDYFFCIVDEVDSVLIDEARTPLIISGQVDRDSHQYDKILPVIRELVNKQTILVNKLIKDAEDMLEKDPKAWEAGRALLLAYKGAPKNTRYMKLRQEPSCQQLQNKVELDVMREKKMVELEAELYYVVDEKQRSVELTEKGREAISPRDPDTFVLIDLVEEFSKIDGMRDLSAEERDKLKLEKRRLHDERAETLHAIQQLLHAFSLKQKDVDYVIEENKVIIVDEFTGRKMVGRRWSDGLHQAVEAKEGVPIERETQTLATVTIQNYFRMYKHLAGMTGTAETEAAEFMHTYKMDVVVIPPNKKTGREDYDDVIYKTKREKYNAVLDEVERLHKHGLPVLVGTTSVQVSETLSRMLRSRKLEHEVLNAKNHAREAEIVKNAGQRGAITIATNMAGRGTDIKLGEGTRESVKDDGGEVLVGGLQIIGTERHEARRIDRQLRGRSGRQGDPGSSRFFLSLEDDLIMWFGGARIAGWMERLGMKEGEPIIHPLVTRSIERAQKKVEQINHERRKRTLDFDNVMNEQRRAIYGLRKEVLADPDIRAVMLEVFGEALLSEFANTFGDPRTMGEANVKGFVHWVQQTIATEDLSALASRNWDDAELLVAACMEHVAKAYDEKVAQLGPQVAEQLARQIALQTIDGNWRDHLLAVDDLREGVFLRSYGQRDPLLEYTRDATALFNEMLLEVQKQIFDRYFRAQIRMEMAGGNRVVRMGYAKPEAQSTTEMVAAQAAAAAQGAPAE